MSYGERTGNFRSSGLEERDIALGCPTCLENSHANHTWHQHSHQTACFKGSEANSPWVRFPSPAPLRFKRVLTHFSTNNKDFPVDAHGGAGDIYLDRRFSPIGHSRRSFVRRTVRRFVRSYEASFTAL